MKFFSLAVIAALLQFANAQILVSLACFAGLEAEMAISSLMVSIVGSVETLTAQVVAAPVAYVAFMYGTETVELVGAAAEAVATAEVSAVGDSVTATASVHVGRAILAALKKPYIIHGETVEKSLLTWLPNSALVRSNLEFATGLSRKVDVWNGVKLYL